MKKRELKVKFFPPIKTAVSFLKSVSKSPENFIYSPLEDEQKINPVGRHNSPVTVEDLRLLERSKSNTFLKDMNELNDVLKGHERLSENVFLPSSFEKLKNLGNAVKNLRKKKVFQRNSLEDYFVVVDDNGEKISPRLAANSKSQNFNETKLVKWFDSMKKRFFSQVAKDAPQDLLDVQKMIIRIAETEVSNILLIKNAKIASLLPDIFQYKKQILYTQIETLKKSTSEEVQKLNRIIENLEFQVTQFNEKNDFLLNETSILKSQILLKNLEIEKNLENIKSLKANREYKIKKDLETYNKILLEFSEFRELASSCINNSVTKAKISQKTDLLKDMILKKFGLLKEKKIAKGLRLSEEQLIEHQMLLTNTDFVFIDKSIQVSQLIECQDISLQTRTDTEEKSVLTDEILDIIEQQENEEDFELNKHPCITIFNENKEEILKSDYSKARELSIFDVFNAEEVPKIRRISSLFKWREFENKKVQTEETVFNEIVKKEEEEVLDWMINDKKNYLANIQSQIINKKNELNKVNTLVNQGQSRLGESFAKEYSRQSSFLSSEESEELLEGEIRYLKSVGIVNGEIEIKSWKHGFLYGYGKAKCDSPLIDGSLKEKGFSDSFKIENEGSPKGNRNSFILENTKNSKSLTKFHEFNFHSKPEKTNSKDLNFDTMKKKYIQEFNLEPSKIILKSAKMSKKMTLKMIKSLYSSALSKACLDEIEDLASFTYNDFSAKFGPRLANKKIIEFLSSVLKYPDNRCTINFAKLIGIGNKIGIDDYVRPKESFVFYLKLLNMIEKSNLGIIIEIEENTDYEFIPAIRAVECTKEILSGYLEPSKISSVIGVIEINSHPDPKKINKFGIIDKEYLTELLLLEIDRHYKEITEAVWTVFESFYNSRNIFKVFKQDFLMVVRYISPDRFQNLLEKMKNDYLNKEAFNVSDLFDLCLELKLLTVLDVRSFIPERIDSQSLFNSITSEEESLKSQLVKVFDKRQELGLSDQFVSEWKMRFENFVKNKNEIKEREVFIFWKIFKLEIGRLNSEIN